MKGPFIFCLVSFLLSVQVFGFNTNNDQLFFPFNNESLTASERAQDLLDRLSLFEKIGMLFMDANRAYGNDSLPVGGDLPSTSVSRLNVSQFNWMGQGNVYRGASNGCKLNCCTSCPDDPTKCCSVLNATQIPQGTGVASTWNLNLIFSIGSMIGDESWAIQNHVPSSDRIYDYRTGASSVINILRDGRWGRAPETYGECPTLTGETALALNKGLMGFDSLESAQRPKYFKVLTVLRHFLAYAGPDSSRFNFNAVVGFDDLQLTYLPAWKRLIEAGAVGGVMSAINAVNQIPMVSNGYLLTNVLRQNLNFDGFVMSDCDTIPAVADNFHFTGSYSQATAEALMAGGDLNCGPEYFLLNNATSQGFLTEDHINTATKRLFIRRVQSGDLNVNQYVYPYSEIPLSVLDSTKSRSLARQIVKESVVLLKNDLQGLPLSANDRIVTLKGKNYLCVNKNCLKGHPLCSSTKHKNSECSFPKETAVDICLKWNECAAVVCEHNRNDCQARSWSGHQHFAQSQSAPGMNDFPSADTYLKIDGSKKVLVVGPSANDPSVQAHTYHGTPWRWTTIGLALNESLPVTNGDLNISYIQGCSIDGDDESQFNQVYNQALVSDAIIFVGGLVARYEEEDTDRPNYNLPHIQTKLIRLIMEATSASNKFIPFSVIIVSGGPISEPSIFSEPAGLGISWLWVSYFGQDGAGVVDNVLGYYSPSGRLPFTIPYNNSQISSIVDYSMTAPPFGRTYRYLTYDLYKEAIPLRPFAFGLSYFDIQIESLTTAASTTFKNEKVLVNIGLVNKGPFSIPGPKDNSTDYVVILFGSFYKCDGSRLSNNLPRRDLLAFEKVKISTDESLNVPLTFNFTSLPGINRRNFPGLLKLWVGDGSDYLGGYSEPGGLGQGLGQGQGQGQAYSFVQVTTLQNTPCLEQDLKKARSIHPQLNL